MEFENEEDLESNATGMGQGELLRSYLAFVVRALKKRRLVVGLTFAVVTSLTIAVVALLPPSYHCEMKLTALRNQVLEDEKDASMLGGARELIKRHDNLIAIVQRADLVHRWDTDRPPVMQLKDRIMGGYHGGEPSEADRLNALVYLLDQRLSINAEDITLTIGVDWPQPETAAHIVDAAEQSFLEARHIEEISTIQEKISILDQHATKVREEIDTIAEQLERLREEKLAEADKVLHGDATAAPASPTPVRRAARAAPPVDDELPRMKEELEAMKRSLAELDGDRTRRLAEARAKLEEIRIRFTPAHPAVLAAEQTIESLSHETPQVASLRADIQQREADIKERKASARDDAPSGGGSSAPPAAAASAKAEVLPSEIMRLLDSGAGVDPTASSHLGSAVAEYTRLHEAIRTKRISLDTAQAAFNHRYKVLVPVEVPNRPSKSKASLILGGGLAAAFALALLIAIIAELRTGVIVERWQVHQMQLPILGELRLPPGPND